MKDTQIALGRDVAESLLVDAGEKEKDKEKEKGRREGTKGAPLSSTVTAQSRRTPNARTAD